MRSSFVEIILAGERLKEQKRRGWIKTGGIKGPESVADHSFATALISMLHGDEMKLDTERMIRMALLHDLGESIIGDLIPGENSSKKEIEDEAVHALLSNLHGKMRPTYERLWEEFRDNTSPEAKAVHQVDKLEMGIQASIYHKKGHSQVHRLIRAAESALENTKLITLWNELKSKEGID